MRVDDLGQLSVPTTVFGLKIQAITCKRRGEQHLTTSSIQYMLPSGTCRTQVDKILWTGEGVRTKKSQANSRVPGSKRLFKEGIVLPR